MDKYFRYNKVKAELFTGDKSQLVKYAVLAFHHKQVQTDKSGHAEIKDEKEYRLGNMKLSPYKDYIVFHEGSNRGYVVPKSYFERRFTRVK